MNRESRIPHYVLLAVLLAGFALRVRALGAQSFWLDEAYTWGVVVNTDWRSVWGAMLAVSDTSPLSYVLAKLAAPLFGVSEFGLRLTSAVFGWLAIAVTYRLGRGMFGRGAGVLAVAFIALSPFAVWYARDARPYGLYLFLSALTLWSFWRAARGRGWGLYVGASAALYLTHYVSALFAYAQAIYSLTQLRRQPLLIRKWALAQSIAVLPVAGWVAAFLARRQHLTANSWIPPVTLFAPLQTLWNFVSGDAARWTLLMAVGLILLAALIAWGARSRSSAAQLLLWWLCLPLFTGWIFSFRLPAYVDRFFEPAILSVAILSAAGSIGLPRRWREVSIAFVLVGLLAGSIRLFVDPTYAKEDWRGAARTIEAEALTVGLPDAESLLGLTPYISSPVKFDFARTADELSARLAAGGFVLVLRSPRDSAHALSKSAPFDPLTEGPEFFLQWRAANPNVPVEVRRFTGLALVVIGSR